MADWLKKQADREAEKEQRRLERLQKKLAEPKHHFTDPEFQQQCHDLSERLEDSVLKGRRDLGQKRRIMSGVSSYCEGIILNEWTSSPGRAEVC